MTNGLLFTTKGKYSGGWTMFACITGLVLSVSIFIANIVISILLPVFLLDDIFIVLAISIMFVFSIYGLMKLDRIKKSFIEIRTDNIEGISIAQKSFRLQYNQILHLERKDNVVVIYFQGGNYEVQAYGVEQQVVNLIQQQKSKIS